MCVVCEPMCEIYKQSQLFFLLLFDFSTFSCFFIPGICRGPTPLFIFALLTTSPILLPLFVGILPVSVNSDGVRSIHFPCTSAMPLNCCLYGVYAHFHLELRRAKYAYAGYMLFSTQKKRL